MTFTIEDSFHNFARLHNKSYSNFEVDPRVFTAKEIAKQFQAHGFPAHLDNNNKAHYIDVQVWRRDLPILQKAQRIPSERLE